MDKEKKQFPTPEMLKAQEEWEKKPKAEREAELERARSEFRDELRRYYEQGNEKTSDGGRNRRIEFKEPYDSFENRVLKTGCRYVEIISGKVALGFKPAPKEGWTPNVKTAVERLTQWGFNVVVFDDSVHVNRNGVTEVLEDGFTVHEPTQSTIFLSSALRPDGTEAAFHEVFHAMKDENLWQYRNALVGLIADNVDTTRKEFEMFIEDIASLYSYSVQNIPNSAFEQEITEEFYAWYIGKIHLAVVNIAAAHHIHRTLHTVYTNLHTTINTNHFPCSAFWTATNVADIFIVVVILFFCLNYILIFSFYFSEIHIIFLLSN